MFFKISLGLKRLLRKYKIQKTLDFIYLKFSAIFHTIFEKQRNSRLNIANFLYHSYARTNIFYIFLNQKSFARELFFDSYDPEVNKPFQLTQKERKTYNSKVSAIGAYEDDRYNYLLYLAKNGIKVNVWGIGWDNLKITHKNLNTFNPKNL